MRFRSQYRSDDMFANVLTETNRTLAGMNKRSAPEAKGKVLEDMTFLLVYWIVVMAILFALMFWHNHMASWTDYEDNARDDGPVDWAYDVEEWLQRQEELANENTPLIRRHEMGPLSPEEVLRLSEMLNDETDKLLRSVKEEPLSPEEVARLTKVIRDADDYTDYGNIGSSRKRKVAEDSDEGGDEQSEKPRKRRLQVETGADANARWVCKEFTRSPSFMSGRDPNSAYSAGCEVPFTFQAPFPGRER
ncbi:MAG: hypothetical protein Q9168_006333 [Polycauliona sp. 1 TL-2023]